MRISAAAHIPPQVLDPSAHVEDAAPGQPTEDGVAVELSVDAVRRVERLSELGLNDQALSEDEEAELDRLRQQDDQVRRRAAMTRAATGGVTRATATQMTTGPDGRRYAVDAQVELGPTAGMTPERQLRLARRLRVSGDDLAVSAARLEAQAREALQETDHAPSGEAPEAVDETGSTGRRAVKAYSAA